MNTRNIFERCKKDLNIWKDLNHEKRLLNKVWKGEKWWMDIFFCNMCVLLNIDNDTHVKGFLNNVDIK